MKKPILLIISILFLLSCDNNKPEAILKSELKSEWYNFELVKFSSPELAKYVYTADIEAYFPPYQLNSVGRCCTDLFLGTNPYIELIDGYYIVDWKWSGIFNSPYNGVFLDYRWEDIKDINQKWDESTEVISNNNGISVMALYQRQEIDKLLGIKLPKDTIIFGENDSLSKVYVRPWWVLSPTQYQSIDNMPDTLYHAHYEKKCPEADCDSIFMPAYTKSDYLHEVAFQDSIQMIYAAKLIEIIKNGQLKKVLTHIYKYNE